MLCSFIYMTMPISIGRLLSSYIARCCCKNYGVKIQKFWCWEQTASLASSNKHSPWCSKSLGTLFMKVVIELCRYGFACDSPHPIETPTVWQILQVTKCCTGDKNEGHWRTTEYSEQTMADPKTEEHPYIISDFYCTSDLECVQNDQLNF